MLVTVIWLVEANLESATWAAAFSTTVGCWAKAFPDVRTAQPPKRSCIPSLGKERFQYIVAFQFSCFAELGLHVPMGPENKVLPPRARPSEPLE